MMMGSPRAKYSGGKLPLHSDLRARGVRGEPISMSKLCLSNICGLNSNINSVHHFLQSNKPHILFLTETQISGKTSTNHLSFPGYELISSFRLRGGVCAYVRNNLSCTRIPNLETGRKDILWLKLSFRTATKCICFVYRSPSDNIYNELFDFLFKTQITSSQNFPMQNSLFLAPLMYTTKNDWDLQELILKVEPLKPLLSVSPLQIS